MTIGQELGLTLIVFTLDESAYSREVAPLNTLVLPKFFPVQVRRGEVIACTEMQK